MENEFSGLAPSLSSALEGGGLSFLFAAQAEFHKRTEDLKKCDVKNRMALRRCQAEVTRCLKPILLVAAEAKGPETRSQCIEALIQATMDNTELAALIGSSGLFEAAVLRCLEPAETMSHCAEYMAGLTLELLIAKVVPEARVHAQILPHIARIILEGETVEMEVRHACVEVLAYLSYSNYRRIDVAAVLTPEVLAYILKETCVADSVMEGSKGKALLTETMEMSRERCEMLDSCAGMDFSVNVHDLKEHCGRVNFSVGMRHFEEIVRRSTKKSTHDVASDLSNKIDGHLFYGGLLMANLQELTVPGTNTTFAEFAEQFWKRTMFFLGCGLCLTAVLKCDPWPPLSDGEHLPLNIVATFVKLVSGGYGDRFELAVQPLAEAIMMRSPANSAQSTPNCRRVARLAAISLRGAVTQSRRNRAEFLQLIQEKDGEELIAAIRSLVGEEPSAGDLLDVISKGDQDASESAS